MGRKAGWRGGVSLVNSLEFFLASKWVSENLPGAKVEKGIFRISDNSFSIEFYSKWLGGKRSLVIEKGSFGFLDKLHENETKEPWKFGREFLSGRTVRSAGQVGFDRILRIDFSGQVSLIHEAFSGNVLILKGENDIIAFALEKRAWKGRKIFPGERYIPPIGAKKSPLELSIGNFKLPENSSLGKFLAVDLGLGPEISNEVVKAAGNDIGKALGKIREIFSATPSYPAFSPDKGTARVREKADTEGKQEARIVELAEKNILALEEKAEEAKRAGNLILQNLALVDSEIGLAREGLPLGKAREFRKKEGILLIDLK